MALHRIRQRLIKYRTQVTNQSRGLLSDFGIIFAKAFKAFREAMIELQDNESLSASFRETMFDLYTEFNQVSERLNKLEGRLKSHIQQNNDCTIAGSAPGISFVNSSAIVASIDQGQSFKNPRGFGAWLGFQPKQYGSGNTFKSAGMTKRGDRYLRTQLIQAARAAKKWAKHRDDQFSLWVKQLEARIGKHKGTVAIAHKLARIIWVLLKKQQCFVPQYSQKIIGT
jgi:transposase